MDIALAAEEFIRQGTYLRNWSPRTATTYRTGMNAPRRAAGNDSELTKADLQHFVVSMRERGVTAGGCNMYKRQASQHRSSATCAPPLPSGVRPSISLF